MTSDFATYMHAQDKTRLARCEMEKAHARLTLAEIRERLAEVRSQFDPLAGLVNSNMSPRDMALALAEYVVTVRFPPLDTKEQD